MITLLYNFIVQLPKIPRYYCRKWDKGFFLFGMGFVIGEILIYILLPLFISILLWTIMYCSKIYEGSPYIIWFCTELLVVVFIPFLIGLVFDGKD